MAAPLPRALRGQYIGANTTCGWSPQSWPPGLHLDTDSGFRPVSPFRGAGLFCAIRPRRYVNNPHVRPRMFLSRQLNVRIRRDQHDLVYRAAEADLVHPSELDRQGVVKEALRVLRKAAAGQ